MKCWVCAVLLGFVVCGPGVSQARHQAFDMSKSARPSAPGTVQQAGVSVNVQCLTAEETNDIFDTDLVGKGIQPLVITIHNDSQQTYQFRKADVDDHYIPAATAARAAYENPIAESAGVATRALSKVWSLLPHKQKEALPSSVLNKEVRASFVREEIADADIGPGGSRSGFMYTKPQQPGSHISVRLINSQTQEPLVFEIPVLK